MSSIINMIKMDMAICRKSMIIMTVSILAAGVCCLFVPLLMGFFFAPLLLGVFIIGSTAVVSAVFAVEDKSNMEFFYGCFPIRKLEYIMGRSLTFLLVIAVPSVISIVFIQIGMRFAFGQGEEMRMLMEATNQFPMLTLCAMIMLSLIDGANLLAASFAGKAEWRGLLELLLLAGEIALAVTIMLLIQLTVYHGDIGKFLRDLNRLIFENESISCVLLIVTGLLIFFASTFISFKIVQRKRRIEYR